MFISIIKKDILRNKVITITLFFFILLSAFLMAAGSGMIMTLLSSVDHLFDKSQIPHFVQMHAGAIDQEKIDAFSKANPYVARQQTVEMIGLDASQLSFNEKKNETNDVMDICMVKQNDSFDFLLDADNHTMLLTKGEIGVPVYYMQHQNLEKGDTISILMENDRRDFVIAGFIRDAQMNPAIVHSKRFLVSDADFEALMNAGAGETEYLIEFRLKDIEDLHEFRNDYQSSGLPAKGPEIDIQLFKTINALTDGMVSVVIVLISLLLIVVSVLCLRFTMLATLEEDMRETGVMKAIGISLFNIKKIYLAKYVFLVATASVAGFILSAVSQRWFVANITRYMGKAPESFLNTIVVIIAVIFVSLIVIGCCLLTLNRINRLSPVKALHAGSLGKKQIQTNRLRLSNSRIRDVSVFLGLKDVLQHPGSYTILFVIFFMVAFLIVVPVNFLNTVKSNRFISYMGIGKSDIRIDLRQTDNMAERFTNLLSTIAKDTDVACYVPMITAQYRYTNSDGVLENIDIESGNHAVFPIDYIAGRMPGNNDEIALSLLNSDEMGKKTGDTVLLHIYGNETIKTVCGIYQDITHGGKTAKALFDPKDGNIKWCVVSINLKAGIDIGKKTAEYTHLFHPARITDTESYMQQTLGETITRLTSVTMISVSVAIGMAVLITSLFMKMMIAKDRVPIAIMRNLGCSPGDIRRQYISRALIVLIAGIITGTLISNTIGEDLVGALWSMMGASQIHFVIKPLQVYVFYPALLSVVVVIATLLNLRSVKHAEITELVAA